MGIQVVEKTMFTGLFGVVVNR